MQILKVSEVIKRTGLSRTTLWRLERDGKFPRSIKLSVNRVGWRENEVDEWIESCPISGRSSM
ncbi:MAG: hypothetical protein AXW17_13185 [Colwellia sp. Phe_37]|nr:MAG: hypothetical protein AXW17_13185 [Colwellia sp. Phe_37]